MATGRSNFKGLEDKLASAKSQGTAAIAAARIAEGKLSDSIALRKQDAIERERLLGELKATEERREAETKAKEEAEAKAAELAEQVVKLTENVKGLQTLVSTREGEARSKGDRTLPLFPLSPFSTGF